ncbi:MAG TPA: hypothetical protein VL598_15970 [Trinickia sp.]|jgi:hypothetical protein|uniref:hypothetical protein n=1 Tax=Trinickia sp. TaxID=2571163 RepID=UPI002C4C103C|nr:hypothetical protein [Trinickia sp.]HTI19148.1 hypothetical protein [Trinickia sp.]
MAAVPYQSTFATQRATRHNPHANLWIWIFICPLAMDYKAVNDASSHLAQVMLAVPTLLAGAILMLIAPRFTDRSSLRASVSLALALAVPASLITQFVQGNVLGQYLRVLLPFLLFYVGYMVACRPWQEARIEQFEKAIFWANVICLAFTFAYGMAIGGPLSDVRYRIVSATFLGLQGVLLHEFVIAKRFTALTLGIFVATVVVELLSVTRSLLVGTALLFLLAVWMSAASMRHLIRALMRAVIVSILLGGVVFGALSFLPDVAQHWTQRIFAEKQTQAGKDPTTITRLAEMKYQYDAVTSSTLSLLIGEGYGREYRYSPTYLPDLEGQMSKKDFYAIRDWPAGHNFWVYQFYAGGLLFGLAMPVAILYALLRCLITYRRWRVAVPDAPYLPVLGRAILLTAALPATSIGGNPLGPRFSGLIFGVSLGLMVSMHVQLRRFSTRPLPLPGQRIDGGNESSGVKGPREAGPTRGARGCASRFEPRLKALPSGVASPPAQKGEPMAPR